LKKFLKEYRVELMAVLLAALGVFLLTERFQIRSTLWKAVQDLVAFLRQGASSTWAFLGDFVRNTTASDLLGYVLLMLALAFIAWRLRYRFIRSRFWNIRACPRCHGPLQRIHRTSMERLFARITMLPTHRYHCTNPDCGWTGLRGHTHSTRRKPPPEIA
jgi:uncharacterized protein YbaR (Trm112 family)